MLDDGYHKRYNFSNGYGASVVSNKYTYGGEDGLFEVAVMHDDNLCYATDIADDVIGNQDHANVVAILDHIKALPPRDRCHHANVNPEQMFEVSFRFFTREDMDNATVSSRAKAALNHTMLQEPYDGWKYLKVIGPDGGSQAIAYEPPESLDGSGAKVVG